MLLPTNAILGALCPLQLLGWGAGPCSALLMGIMSFLARVTPFSMSATPFLMPITSFPASVSCFWRVLHTPQHLCHHHPGLCHLLPSECHPHPGMCHPICSMSRLHGMHCTFPSICHSFPACHPLSRMDHPVPSACPRCGCCPGSNCSWSSLFLAKPCREKPHFHPFLFMAQTALAHQQQKKGQRNIYSL